MDLSSKEFTLNFRGFEQDDPETVKRFTAFCEANFALSPDTFRNPMSCADAVVLTHGESPESLEALAKVLREIGARVEVSKDCRIEEHAALDGPSPQEIHRLFGHHQENRTVNEEGPSSPYPLLGRTLYLLNSSDHIWDRKRLRTSSHRAEVIQQHRLQKPQRQIATLVAISVLSLAIGTLALVATALLIKRTPDILTERKQRLSFQSRELADNVRYDGSGMEVLSPKSSTSNTHAHGFNVVLKVLASLHSSSFLN